MEEKLTDIVKRIESFEIKRGVKRIFPVARVHCTVDGRKETYWFTNEIINPRELGVLKDCGRFVPKNSWIAIQMQKNEIGTYIDYDHKDEIKRLRRHQVLLENRTDFQNQTINIKGDNLIYQYRNIQDFLRELIKNQEDIKEIEAKISQLKTQYKSGTPIERRKITLSINELQKEYRILTQQQEDLKNITIYIRKQGEMRYSLIVDTIQTRIKTQNLFDGTTLIIDGGPGTGKSTTMIHRLAYLTDNFAIDEDETNRLGNYKLNSKQRNLLREAIKSHRDWMFFSPSKLLKDYLAAAMQKEGLKNTSTKVWNWRDYCVKILQEDYKLLETNDNKAPFYVCKLQGTLFHQKSNMIEEFNRFYIQQLRSIKKQLPVFNDSSRLNAWKLIAIHISKRFQDTESYDIAQFIILFNSLRSTYGEECREYIKSNKVIIAEFVDKIIELLNDNKTIRNEIVEILSLESIDFDDSEEGTDDTLEENEQATNLTVINKPDVNLLSSELQRWLKTYCNYKANPSVKPNEKYQLISEMILPILGNEYDEELELIGEMFKFEQIARYTQGLKVLLLKGIPSVYKKFRTHLSKSKHQGCNLSLMRDILHRKQGRELHHQELSLLLGFINTLIKRIKACTSEKINHNFVEAYNLVSRPIIGVDEATDFSVCDIYAIQSLLSYEFSSLTLCGDMMQRMTSYGITSWSELKGIVANPIVVEMKTSYRQSKKLLDLAKKLYEDTLHSIPQYKPFMKSNTVPAPLVYISESEQAKIDWISKRISEVYRAYGDQLPSIAIFVNDKGYILRFVEMLQQTEFFKKNRIKVVDGNNKIEEIKDNYISVYSIDVVKGMEFDVVFFHNLDNSSVEMEILKRFIYVGVSRAAFFLGVTLSEPKHEICKYFEKNKDWFKI